MGGDNAGRLRESAEVMRAAKTMRGKTAFVFSAPRSTDANYNRHVIVRDKGPDGQPKSGFNTTSHLIQVAKSARAGKTHVADVFVDAVDDFGKHLIAREAEQKHQRVLLETLAREIAQFRDMIREASHLPETDRKEQIFNIGVDYLWGNRSITGFGERLGQTLYSAIADSEGFSASASDSQNEWAQTIYENDPRAAMKMEVERLQALRKLLGDEAAEFLSSGHEMLIAGAHLPLIGTSRGYGDIVGAEFAERFFESRQDVLLAIAKAFGILSADPGIVGKEANTRTIPAMTYALAGELFSPLGAEAGAVHANAIKILEKGKIRTVVLNPSDLDRGSTLITNEYEPEEGPTEIIASRILPSALEITSTDMADRNGVVSFITNHLDELQIDQIYTTGRKLYLSFDAPITPENVEILRRILLKKYKYDYGLRHRTNIAIVFCLANNMDSLEENARASFALKRAGIKTESGGFISTANVVTFVVNGDDTQRAVKALHHELIEERKAA